MEYRRHETSAREYLAPSGMPVDSKSLLLLWTEHEFTLADNRRSGTPSRFDASFYRTHDSLGYIPSDAQSLRSQATYSSGLPLFNAPGPFGPGMSRGANGAGKRSNYSYASSIISQDAGPSVTDNSSVVGHGSQYGGGNMGGQTGQNMAYSQSDRLRRRGSFGSASAAGTDMGSASGYDYKSQDSEVGDLDDMKSQYAGTQSGVTVF